MSRIADNVWRFQLGLTDLADVSDIAVRGPKPAMTSVNLTPDIQN